jgi:glycosyltransferase involved in cell wall biosynthesis
LSLEFHQKLLGELESQPLKPLLSVVVPAYNEERTLAGVVSKLLLVPGLAEIVIVDDASSDKTYEIATRLAQEYEQVRVLRQPQNRGKTAALRAGIAETRGEIVLIQDADYEYDATEIPGLIQPIVDGVADAVYGSRFLVRKAARVLYFNHYLANKALTFLSNIFTNVNLSDVETGYKAFRGEVIRSMNLTATGFGFEIEVTAKLAKLRCALYEVPISYYGRTYEEGKKIRAKDAFAALWFIFKYNLFCNLKSSFHSLPVSRDHEEREIGTARQE